MNLLGVKFKVHIHLFTAIIAFLMSSFNLVLSKAISMKLIQMVKASLKDEEVLYIGLLITIE